MKRLPEYNLRTMISYASPVTGREASSITSNPLPITSNRPPGRAGFTLIELLLVVVIIGVLLAVIVPRAWRANIDTKYATLRQTCVQLSGFANDWAERQLIVTGADSLNGVMTKLADDNPTWIASSDSDNGWKQDGIDVGGDQETSSSVQNLVPNDPPLRNPFTGLEVFRDGNNDGAPGAIACAYDTDDGQNYYALIFRSASDTGEFYAGQGTDLAGLRNGIFINKLMP